MGLRGPLGDDTSVEVTGGLGYVPEPPPGLHEDVVDDWETYWTSGTANVVDEVDIPMVRRLFLYRDEHYRLGLLWGEMGTDERVVEGSRHKDSLRLHPFGDRMKDLEALIAKLEDKLGLSPLARARLGIEIGQAQLTWAEVMKGGARGEVASGHAPRALPVAVVEEDEDGEQQGDTHRV